MQAGRRYTLWQTIHWMRKYLLIFLILDTLVVILYELFFMEWLAIPWQPISVIGIAVAFYLGFKNNSSYERLWEARKIWGGIVNVSRSFTVMSRDFITNTFAAEKHSDEALYKERKSIVHRHVAWLHALTYQLRKLKDWEHNGKSDQKMRGILGLTNPDQFFVNLKEYLTEVEYKYIMSKGNKASHLLSLQSKHLAELRVKGLIEDFRHMELQGLITEMYTLEGKAERIKNFPFPRQYASVNYFFVCIFIFLLPFAMLSVFDNTDGFFIWLAIPFTVLASWVFWTMEMIGDYSENPFEGLYNDVPITAMARGIEIDIRQMLEETDLPKPVKPVEGMNILY